MFNLLFGLNGSVDRLPYFLVVTACQIILAGLTSMLLYAAAHPPVESIQLAAFVAGALACAWVSFAMTWKRLHDFELHGAWALLMFVPVVGVAMYLLFSYLKGDIADPPYHVPPPSDGA